jgi:UDPglucose--hexose-1-phosphate uridylyltransferase
MGCSNPHPHGQAWSTSSIPNIPAKELESLAQYSTSEAVSPATAPKGPNGQSNYNFGGPEVPPPPSL